jgi:hypothetical protein
MKRLITILFSLIVLAAPTARAIVVTFSDVPQGHRYFPAIESLKNLQIINGYADGTFKPDNPVIRAEALKMILKSANVPVLASVDASGFNDVPVNEWYAPHASMAKQMGIVKGDGATNQFVPARQVNKSEFLKMLIEAFDKDISKHTNLSGDVARDVPANAWFAPYFSYGKTLGIVSPLMGNYLEPSKNLTRGECAEIIYKMLILERGGETQKMINITEAKLVDVMIHLNNNDINSALISANDAVFYANSALSMAPEDGTAKAVQKIATGFQKLCLAYKSGLECNLDAARTQVAEAKDLAGWAYVDDPATQPVGKKIKQYGDSILSQINSLNCN